MAQQSHRLCCVENATPLPVKAGGVRTYDEAVEMIKLGVKRIGTSGAKQLRMEEIQMWDTNFTIKAI
jgi:deoxyribose-phosphate aldolase